MKRHNTAFSKKTWAGKKDEKIGHKEEWELWDVRKIIKDALWGELNESGKCFEGINKDSLSK